MIFNKTLGKRSGVFKTKAMKDHDKVKYNNLTAYVRQGTIPQNGKVPTVVIVEGKEVRKMISVDKLK